MDTNLNFINRSSDTNNSEVVIFQRNVATDFDEVVVAWLVIKNSGQGDNRPFHYPMEIQVSASDSWGNYTPKLTAETGNLYHVTKTTSGDTTLSLEGRSTSPREVQVANDFQKGTINANIYKAGRLLATKASVAPGQKVAFEFKPTIWIGVVSQVTEGQIMDAAITSEISTGLSLLGIASADIVMTGGGPEHNSTPFQFHLENVEMA